jgi:hypothetical protein
MKIGRYDLTRGHMGNGEVIWDSARMVNGDYPKIAHVAYDGTLTLYKKRLPVEVVEWLRKEAADYAAQNPKWHNIR